VGYKGMILKGFGFVAFFAGVKSQFLLYSSIFSSMQSVLRGEWSRLFCSHKGRSLQ
jgi:hypothetical protein